MIRSMMVMGAALLMSACATTVGSSDATSVPDDAVEVCETQCKALGLELDALAVGKRDVGCICEPED
jgi:hypothetical protein